MSIAINIVSIARKEAEKESAPSISMIELEVGKLAGVMVDSLQFCYEAACKGTLAEGSELQIIELEGQAKCMQCGNVFTIDSFMAICPKCDTYEIEIIQGKELRLKAISINEEGSSHV
ncbi:MAG: hydrogenase maturation nickel metallochaperone HypA [Candidatus Marinimicrobia bacterium]|nr:hydrogenase maturation nickel metallochaperone HypA [Candidatus Neomarinimicrobiota bacterium]MCF7850771.1 hydrogenase maturation nickel metallochaperone HypA [Candidatus Neomarinimicrobiota bacterium]MCF7904269.1 hydrogenase maturation nickel metallochaperone HypA [Candidatus Neomarinimicrobiota bacterium]